MSDVGFAKDSGFGVDVAVQRADDLDKKILSYIKNGEDLSVLELGCGAGGQSIRMALAGAKIIAIDIIDFADKFNELVKVHNLNEESLKFRQGDIRNISEIVCNHKFDIACLQRVIHYLTYQEALTLLGELCLLINKKLFISVSGINSDIGINYQHKENDISERYCYLDSERAELFNIKQPLCLYTKEEFQSLLEESGWRVEEIWVSAFGNIKAICG